MNIQDLRRQFGGLENLSDDDIVQAFATVQGIDPNTPGFDDMANTFKGYDRSTGDVIQDTAVNLGQGVLKIGSNLSSAFGAWDNPVRRGLDTSAEWLGDRFISEGLRNQMAGTQVYSGIREREADARGLTGDARVFWDAQTQFENYRNAPGTLGSDFVTNAPQLVVGGLAGRGVQLGARALGLGARTAQVAGTATATGTAGVMQGADIGAQTYDEALRVIMQRNDTAAGREPDTIVVTPDGSTVRKGSFRTDLQDATEEEIAEATRIANEAALKSGAFTAATSLLPGTLERSMVPGVRGASTRLGAVARTGATETVTNAVDEGYGEYVSGEGVSQVDPTVDPWAGVGGAAVQGAGAGGPTGAVVGLRTPLVPRQLPRTETGEVDLAGNATPPGAPVRTDVPPPDIAGNLDTPTWVRQGADPLNERSSPWSPPAPNAAEPAQVPLLPYNPPTTYVDPTGAAQVGTMPTEQEVAQRKYAPRPVPPEVEAPVAEGGDPVAAETADTVRDIRRAVREVSQRLKPGYLKKDGDLTKTAEAVMAPFLTAEDPVQALRDAHKDGANPRDELLDAIHEQMTGQTVFDWKAAQQTPEVNSAGFVPEPVEQLQAQLEAARQGRKDLVVLGTDQVNELDLSGLSKSTAVDPVTGDQAVVVSRNRAAVQQAVARTQEVGLRQAMGEAQNVVDPTLTSQPVPPEQGAVTVQQVDNQSGEVLADEVVTPENVDNVQPIPDTTRRVVPVEQPVRERQQRVNAVNSEPAAVQQPAATPTKRPRYGRKSVDELIEIAENAKGEAEYNESRYQLYKRWANDSADGGDRAEAYLSDTENRSALTEEERAEFNQRLQDEADQSRARKFNSAKARPASEVSGEPLSVQQVQNIVASVARLFPGARGIRVARNPAEVGLDFDAGFSVSGVTMPDGSIVLFSDGITSRMDALNAIFHELFHQGVTTTPDYQANLRDIASRDPWIQAQANKWKLTQDGQRHARREDLTPEQYEALAVEEALARVSEQLQGGENIGSRQTAIRGLVKWLAAKADAWGMPDLARRMRRQTYTEAERFVMDTIQQDQTTAPTPTTETVRARADDSAATIEEANSSPPLNPINRAFKAATASTRAATSGKEISPSLLRVLTLRQIDEQYGKKLPALRKWIGAIFERGSQAGQLAAKADRTARKWESLDRTARDTLGEILLGASVAGVSPANNSAEYLASLDADQRAEHTRLRQRYNALPQSAKDVHAEVRAVLDEQWTTTRNALETFVEHVITDPELRAERIKQIREEMGKQRGDYFPLSRFGDRVVIGRGAAKDGRDVISFHETAASAEAEVDRLRREGTKHVVVNLRTERDSRQRASTDFMGQLHGMIDEAQMDPIARESMHEALQQLYLKSLPELSGAKHMIRRENIEGYSKDALRSFADAVARGARYAAQLAHAPNVQAAMESAESQSRSSDTRTAALVVGTKDGQDPVVRVVPVGLERMNAATQLMNDGYTVSWANVEPATARERLAQRVPGLTDAQIDQYVSQIEGVVGRTEDGVEDLRAAKALYNYMVERMRVDNVKKDTILDSATDTAGQVGFTWFLGLTPAYWMMNALQNPMVGLPHLGGKYGLLNSATEWFSAAGWFGGVRMGKFLRDRSEPFSIEWLRKQNVEGISKQELDMLQTLEDHQVLDFTQSMDLSRIAESTSGKWNKAMRFAAAGAHHTEVFNRVTYALAAYRLALKSSPNMTHEQAVQRAENDVASAHFDYSSSNKPDLMRGRFSRLMFMFQQYRQHMLYWWGKQVQDAVKGESRDVRLAAGKSMVFMMTTHGLFAGAMGLPFIGAVQFVSEMVAGMFGDEDEEFDFERWLQEAATAQLGEQGGRFFTKGAFDAMGMTIGQRIGQQDLMPFLNQGSARFERNADDKMRAYLFDLWGPLGSIALGAARAGEAFNRGDTAAALSHITPKAVSDLIKADTLSDEGVKNSRGQVLASAEAFDGYDVFLQAIGVAPSSAQQIKEKRGRILDMENHLNDRSRVLTGSFVEAWKRRDATGIRESMQAIQAYNAKLAKKDLAQLGITGRRLESAIRDRLRRDMLLALTGGTAETRRQLLLVLRASGAMQQDVPIGELPSID